MGIFKAYDVRGKCPGDFDDAFAKRLGRAYADFLGNQGQVVVGHDMRDTSPSLAQHLAQGLHEGGVDTLEIGLCTSPTLYYVVGSRGAQGGVMVTASHNPAGDNGFKICREQVIPVGQDSGLLEIKAKVEAFEAADPAPHSSQGQATKADVLGEYLDHVTKVAGQVGPQKVAFDCGNGVTGPTLRALLERWSGLETVVLYDEPDGTFPNHPANPLVPGNLVDLQQAVKEHGCQLGVAFDGDGDRCVLIDDQGEIVHSDLLTALLARRVLRDHPGAAVVYDLVSSQVVAEEVSAAGGKPIEEKVGHSFIKRTMREHDAAFAGENSGHYYFREHWYADSGLIAAGRVLALLTEEQTPLSELLLPLRRTAKSGEKNFQVPDKDAALEQLVGSFPGAEVTRIDGVTIRTDGFWFNARKSNTEPLVRVNAEAADNDRLAAGMLRIQGVLGEPVDH